MTTPGFNLFPFNVKDADCDILLEIENNGIRFFGNYISEINNDNCKLDKLYFTKYLNYYLFEDNSWDQLIIELKTDKKYINLIDHIHNNYHRKTFALNIIKLYKENDIDQIIINPKIISLFDDFEYDTIIENMISEKRIKISSYLKYPETQERTIRWLRKYYDTNKHFKQFIGIHMSEYNLYSKKMAEAIRITIEIYDAFKIIKEISEKDDDYLAISNELFILIHDFMDLSILNISSLRNAMSDALDELNDRYNMISIEDEESRNILMAKIMYFTRMKDEIDNINIDFDKCKCFFRNDSIEWLNNIDYPDSDAKQNNYDNIIYNTIEYLSYENNILLFEDTIYNVFMKILDYNKRLTASVELKAKTMMIISKYMELDESQISNYIENDIELFVKNMVYLFLEITKVDSDTDVYIYQHSILQSLFEYQSTIYDTMNKETIVKFINEVIRIYNSFFEGYILLIRKFYDYKNNRMESEYIRHKAGMLKGLEWYQETIFMVYHFVIYSKFITNSVEAETRDNIVMSIGKNLDTLCGSDCKKLKIKENIIYFDPIRHLKNTFNILYAIYDYKEIKKTMVQQEHTVNTNYMKKMVDILLRKNKILWIEFMNIQKFAVQIEKGREKEKEVEERNIPEEFLDPIIGSIIENPVLLPNSNTIMERDVILRHLVTTQDNPFNREPLTKNQLEEYNERDNIKELILDFQRRKNEILRKN